MSARQGQHRKSDALGFALKAAGFSQKAGLDEQATQRVYLKQELDSVNVWANPEWKPDFKNPKANGTIGIDMTEIAPPAPTASAKRAQPWPRYIATLRPTRT